MLSGDFFSSPWLTGELRKGERLETPQESRSPGAGMVTTAVASQSRKLFFGLLHGQCVSPLLPTIFFFCCVSCLFSLSLLNNCINFLSRPTSDETISQGESDPSATHKHIQMSSVPKFWRCLPIQMMKPLLMRNVGKKAMWSVYFSGRCPRSGCLLLSQIIFWPEGVWPSCILSQRLSQSESLFSLHVLPLFGEQIVVFLPIYWWF